MLIVGIDPSLTGTGVVVLRHGVLEFADTAKNQPELGTIERVRKINEAIMYVIENLISDDESEWKAPDLIVIEGFSYGSKGRSVFDIAYLGYRIREELERLRIEDGIPWIEVSPTQLKQFATGKGNANKEIILQQVYKRWNVELTDNNQADAYVLAQIGRAYLGEESDLTAFQQEVIANLKGEKKAKKRRVKAE